MTRLVLLLALVLLPACAHMHIGDCASCAGYVAIQDQVRDEAQTKQIFEVVGKAFQQQAQQAQQAPEPAGPRVVPPPAAEPQVVPTATPAPVTSKTAGGAP